jgi:serine/threonine protein kinase/tetratricopeptide (TPR) repeat protein
MNRDELRLDSIFLNALEKADASERAAYLDSACGTDQRLRRRVERFLATQPKVRDFLESPAAGLPVAVDQEIAEQPGAVIGPYKLLEQIGEGGMGLVFMAEQKEPVRRKVALKLIKPGMDSKQVIARFEAERQALAMMDHPNIAKVLEAGTTNAGRPYFVMELVHGIAITDYCDQAKFTIRQRLKLFVKVCRAVQHAHMKGIIHRDLKPGNVLVTSNDVEAVPKVIDFGVAKALGPSLTEQTLNTGFAQMIGTPLYMSPEQAEFNQAGVDTRSDIYSLGVLLYELLTGTTPLNKKRLRKSTPMDILRLIREEEPRPPSARVSTLGAKLETVSEQRGAHPQALCAVLRGELDWIILKALDKDRGRRYETASEFAADIKRYLADEPVAACPPSRRYRMGKFLRKHRKGLSTAAALLMMAAALAATGAWFALDKAAREAEQANQQAKEQAAIAKAVDDDMQEAAHWQRQERWDKALQTLERAKGRLQGNSPEALRRRVEQSITDIAFVARLQEPRLKGSSYLADGKHEANRLYAALFAERGLTVAVDPEKFAGQIRMFAVRDQLIIALEDWADVKDDMLRGEGDGLRAIIRLADDDPWRKQIRDHRQAKNVAVLLQMAKSDDVLNQPPAHLILLSNVLTRSGWGRDTLPVYYQLLRRAQHRYPSDFWLNMTLADRLSLQAVGKKTDPTEPIGFYRAAIAVQPQYPEPYFGLALAFWGAEARADAVLALRKVVELRPTFVEAHEYIGAILRKDGKLPEAEAAYRKAIELQPGHAGYYRDLGLTLSGQQKHEEAARYYQIAAKVAPGFADAHYNLGLAFREQGKLADAEAALRRAIELNLDRQQKMDKREAFHHRQIQKDLALNFTALGVVLNDQEKWSDAEKACREAIAIDADHAEAYQALGASLAGQKKLVEAEDAYRKAKELKKEKGK